MPGDKAMHKYKAGTLHSGSKHGPVVKSRKQAVAIMLSEKRAEGEGSYKKASPKQTIGVEGPVSHGTMAYDVERHPAGWSATNSKPGGLAGVPKYK